MVNRAVVTEDCTLATLVGMTATWVNILDLWVTWCTLVRSYSACW